MTSLGTSATNRAAFRAGVVEVAPLMLGIIPFGLVAGVSAVDAGLGLSGAVGLSTIVFAGASQLAAIDLLRQGTPTVVIVATMLVINLRFAMYSAALAPLVTGESRGRRALMSYLLVDQPFALTVSRDRREPGVAGAFAYYMGCATTMWTAWQATTIAGALLGATLPDWLPLGAAIPLMFLIMLIPTVTDRATVVAATSGGLVAVLAAGLPSNIGLLVAAATGIVLGTVVAERQRTPLPEEAT